LKPGLLFQLRETAVSLAQRLIEYHPCPPGIVEIVSLHIQQLPALHSHLLKEYLRLTGIALQVFNRAENHGPLTFDCLQ
jgi:hypothetical protein